MSGSGEIKNVLTLDVTKFNSAIDKATANLESLDKQLKSAGKMAADFEKNIAAMGGDMTGTAEKFKLLDQSVAMLVTRLDKAGSAGFDGFSSKTRKAKQDIEELATTTKSAGSTLLSMSDWVSRYGQAVDNLNPIVTSATQSQRKLSASIKETVNDVKTASAEQIQARMKALEAEKKTNEATVNSRRKMVSDLQQLDAQLASQQVELDKQAARFFGKNKSKGDSYRASSADVDEQRAQAQAQLAQINRATEALRYENVQIAQGIDLAQKELAAVTAASAVRQRAAEERVAATRVADAEERAARQAALEAALQAKEAEKKATEERKASKRAAREAERQENQAAKEAARADLAQKRADERRAKEEAKATAKELRDFDRATKEEAKQRKRQEREEARQAAAEDKALAKSIADAERDARSRARDELNGFRADDRAAAAERALADKNAMQATRERLTFEREQAVQITQMWKSMGQLWGASKIEKGLAASVDSADKAERTTTAVKSLGYSDEHNKAIMDSAFDMSKSLRFISTLDAVKSRMSAIASLGEDNADIIDKTLSTAVKAANNLQYLGMAHGDQQSIIRNLYGVVEMRQQTGNAQQTNQTFEVLQKIINGTQGKVQTEDMETVMRRIGVGAGQLSDHGMMNLAAIVDQFKVAGGDGGAGGGVSTVGTAFKMMQAYAMGKGKSKEALKEFSGAGILDTDSLNLSQDKAGVLRDGKNAGFKDAALWMSDPVAAVQKIMPQIIAFTQKKENAATFYQGADQSDPQAQLNAVTKYLQRLGITQTAATALITAGDPRSAHRIEKQVETMSGSKSIDAVNEDASQTYGRKVEEVSASLTNLKVTVGNALLPILKDVLTVTRDIIDGFAKFAKDNPMTLDLTLAAAAAGGLILAFKGFMGLMGLPGKLASSIGLLVPALKGAEGAAGASGASLMSLGGTLSALKGHWAEAGASILTAAGNFTAVGSAGTGVKLLGTTVMSSAKMVAKGFLTMLPLVGELLIAWDMAQLLSHVKVGGHEIGEWMGKWLDDIVTAWDLAFLKIEGMWLRTKNVFTDQAGAIAQNLAKQDALSKDKANKDKVNGFAYVDPRIAATVDSRSSNLYGPLGSESLRVAEASRKKKAEAGGVTAKDSALSAIAGGPGDKHHREFENAFQRSYEQMAGRQTIEQLKLGTIMSGDDSYEAQAIAAFKEKWLGGDFDDGKDPSKRKFVKGGKTFNKDKGWSVNDLDMGATDKASGKTVQQWLDEYAAGKKLEDQTKAVSFAKERASATDQEAAASIAKLTGQTDGQTDAMKALNAEFAREEARNPTGVKGQTYLDSKSKALTGRATADYASTGADLKDKNASMSAKWLETEKERQQAAADAAYEAERKKTEAVRQALDTRIALMEKEGQIGTKEYFDAIDAREAGEAQFTQYLKNIAEERARALETPIQRMARDWKDSLNQIEQAQVTWANGFVDQVYGALSKSKGSWKDYARSIVEELAKIAIKRALVEGGSLAMGGIQSLGAAAPGALMGLGGAYNKAVFGSISPMTPNSGPQLPAGVSPDVGAADAAQAMQGFTTAVTASTAATAADKVATQASTVATLTDTSATESDTLATILGTTATETDASTTWTEVAATWADVYATQADSAAKALAKGGVATPAGLSMFANGGAFTNSLVDTPTMFQFANGGQFGLMGEAGPEAVMPLSRDGSGRLGVSLHGGSGGGIGVSISINVDNSGASTTQSSGDTTDWDTLANRVKGVVVQELANQQRPGGALYR